RSADGHSGDPQLRDRPHGGSRPLATLGCDQQIRDGRKSRGRIGIGLVSRTLRRKVRRDVWRERWRFAAIAAIMAIGVAVFTGPTASYRNLDQSFARAYAAQRLPDAILSGPGAAGLRDAVANMPGSPMVDVRHQADVGMRLSGHALYGRAVGVPDSRQPTV